MNRPSHSWVEWWSLAFALAFPTLVTWVYFVALADSSPALQKSAYAIGKVIQFGLPIVWVLWIRRETAPAEHPSLYAQLWGLVLGGAFGLLILGAILGIYYGVLEPAGFFGDAIKNEIKGKLHGFGIAHTFQYLVLALFYCVVHSLLEEYYWRWFVFRALRQRLSLAPAAIISGLGFMAHHVLVLGKYFGWDSPATYLFSLGVAIGGGIWACLYDRTKSLLGPWLSHALVDAAIFIIGYHLVRDLLK